MQTLPVGTRLREFRILDIIGSGGFGVTYLADHEGLARQYALKEHFPQVFARRDETGIQPHPNSKSDYEWSLDQFLEEARTLARFKHPNIVHVSNIFKDSNTAYMALDFVDGQTMKDWLASATAPPSQQDLDTLLTPLLDALELLHENDTLHRDIAPDNILIEKNGNPVLIDFGSARMIISGKTGTLTAVVKDGYSPFEQYVPGRKQAPSSDIYALAATLYRAVTGTTAPVSLGRADDDTFVPAKEVAQGSYRPGFLAAIDDALAVFSKDRPQSINEWRSSLLDVDDGAKAPASSQVDLPSKRSQASEAPLRRLSDVEKHKRPVSNKPYGIRSNLKYIAVGPLLMAFFIVLMIALAGLLGGIF